MRFQGGAGWGGRVGRRGEIGGCERGWSDRPDSEGLELLSGDGVPVAIGGWASGAGMEDATDFGLGTVLERASFGETADANDPFWLEDFGDSLEVSVAGSEERF